MNPQTAEIMTKNFMEMLSVVSKFSGAPSKLEDLLMKEFFECFAQAARKVFQKFPQPKSGELEQMLDKITIAKKEFAYTLRKQGPILIKKHLPHAPGGYPPKFHPEQKRELCERILEFTRKEGLSLADAKGRVAAKAQVSRRTIQRVWSGRKQWLTTNPQKPAV